MFGMLIFERVCMFQNPMFCHIFCSSNLTQDLKLAFRRDKTGSGISCMSQNLVFCRPFCPSNITGLIQSHGLGVLPGAQLGSKRVCMYV